MKKVFGILLVFLFMLPMSVSALSCVERPPVEEAYERADAVIIATVVEEKTGTSNDQYKLHVNKSYKAITDAELWIAEDATWGTSQVGEEYLFFLNEFANGWENPLCNSTIKTADAANDLDWLQDKEIPLSSGYTPQPVSEEDPNPSKTEASATDEAGSTSRWSSLVITVLLIAVVLAVAMILYRMASHRS